MLYMGERGTYMPLRSPMGTSNNRKAALVVNYPSGGPLSCTAIITRWG